jgi:hypothetical protein
MMGLLFFAKRVVWFFWDNPRYLVTLLAFIILVLIGMQMKGCFTRTPKFNEDEIRRAQKAIAEDNRKEMVEVLAQSEVREKNIDANKNTISNNFCSQERRMLSQSVKLRLRSASQSREKPL